MSPFMELHARRNQLLEAALGYASRNWLVFPCRPRSKRPITPCGLKDATTDSGLIEAWWLNVPEANVAVRTGCESGVVVLDVDGDDGAEALQALERERGALPRTASVVTPSGGQHYYFTHPGGQIRSTAGMLGPGLDVRGDGGYVIAPPSLGANGRAYEPDERRALASLPGWLLRILTDQGSAHDPKRVPASEWLAILCGGLPEGQRNAGLTRLAGRYLRLLHVDEAVELIHLVNAHRCRPPLARGEVDALIDSIATRELLRRRGARA